MPAQRSDGGVRQESVQLAFRSALAADRLRERERVSDPPDDEGPRDDVLFIARQHLGVTGLINTPPHVEPGGLIDRPGKLPVEARGRVRAHGASEARDQRRLPLLHDHRHGIEDNRQRAPANRPWPSSQRCIFTASTIIHLHPAGSGNRPLYTCDPPDLFQASPAADGKDILPAKPGYCDSSVRKAHAWPAALANVSAPSARAALALFTTNDSAAGTV